jgi:hypothetical protein
MQTDLADARPLNRALEARTILYRSLQIFLIIVLSGCSVISEHRDWNFVQQVGGLTVIGQDKNSNWLILRGNVSGLKEFSHKPTLVNSALVVKEVGKKITTSKIQIFVVTTITSEKYPSPEITGIDITGIAIGTYQVEYLNPDGSSVYLSDVEIK